jgi:hypothetical protein
MVSFRAGGPKISSCLLEERQILLRNLPLLILLLLALKIRCKNIVTCCLKAGILESECMAAASQRLAKLDVFQQ